MQDTFYYEVRTPENYDDSKKYPMLVAFHGIGHNESFTWNTFEELTDEFIVVGVRGHMDYNNGYAFYYLEGFGKPDMESFDDCMEKLPAFIEDLIEEYPVDKDHVYLGGFSQGAILSNSLALLLGDKISGIVSMNGYVPEFLEERYGVKDVGHLDVFLSDGRDDEIFPPHVGGRNEEYFKEKGANVIYTTYDTAHTIGDENKADAVKWLRSKIQ